MATHTLDEIHCYSTTIRQRSWDVGNDVVDHFPVMTPTAAISPERRSEARKDCRRMCSYEVLDCFEETLIVIGQGGAFAVNRSAEGVFLLMAMAPYAKQLIEVQTSRSGCGKTANIFEVRWVELVRVESLGRLYLVGCRHMLGPCHYLLFSAIPR